MILRRVDINIPKVIYAYDFTHFSVPVVRSLTLGACLYSSEFPIRRAYTKTTHCTYADIGDVTIEQSLSGKWRCLDNRTIIARDKILYAPLSQTDKEHSRYIAKQLQDEIGYLMGSAVTYVMCCVRTFSLAQFFWRLTGFEILPDINPKIRSAFAKANPFLISVWNHERCRI